LKELRDILTDVISKDLPKEPVALLFSGGTDSLTVLWTLLNLGMEVHCYTFRLSYFESTDARVSQKVCNQLGIQQTIVSESTAPIPDQLHQVISIIKSPRKTHVEVMYGYYFLMKAVNEHHVYSGIQADTLYGSNKNAAIQCGKKSAEYFTQYRKKLLESPGQEGHLQANMVANHFGKILHTPYSDQKVRDFFFKYSWSDLNRPKQKMPAIISFKPEFRDSKVYRKDDNMQCGSHLREHLQEYVKEYRRIYANINR